MKLYVCGPFERLRSLVGDSGIERTRPEDERPGFKANLCSGQTV